MDEVLYIGALIYTIGCWFSLIDAWRSGDSGEKKLMIIIGILYSPIYVIWKYIHAKTKVIAIIFNYLGLLLIVINIITVRLI